MEDSSILLNSGYKMPLVGLGTWQSKPGEVKAAVKHAVDLGYRHVDCAWAYQNETEIGESLTEIFKEGKVKREELFVVTKLAITFHKAEDVRAAFIDSLKKLQLEYVDLYLIHFPCGFCKEPGSDGLRAPIDADYVDTWKELEKLKTEGLVRSIGVSNFNEYQINRLLKEGSVTPAVNQIEVHPYFLQTELVSFCLEKNIAVTGYCPLGARGFPGHLKYFLLEDPTLIKIANRLNKTVAQVALRFEIQRNIIVIPKSVTPSRIKENFEVFDFKLSDSDMKLISSLNKNYRICDGLIPGFRTLEHKYFPFKDNYVE